MPNRTARLDFVAGVAPGYLGMRSSARKTFIRRVFPNVNWAQLVSELLTIMPRYTLAARLLVPETHITHWVDGLHVPNEFAQEMLIALYNHYFDKEITAEIKKS